MTSLKWARMAPAALCAVFVAAAAGSAVAATRVIDTPQFQIRYDDARTGLYGTPVWTGESLSWFPGESPGFEAMALHGFDAAVSSFALRVQMKPGFLLEGVRLEVEGDWLAMGRATVAAFGLLRVAPRGGTAERDAELFLAQTGLHDGDPFEPTAWHGRLDATLDEGASFARLSLQTFLMASARPRARGHHGSWPSHDLYGMRGDTLIGERTPDFLGRHAETGWHRWGGALAYVDVKQASLHFTVSAIPEPANLALMLAGLGLLAGAVRARRGPGRGEVRMPTGRERTGARS